MEQRLAASAADTLGVQAVHKQLAQTGDSQTHAEPIRSWLGGLDIESSFQDLVTSVSRVIGVGVAVHGVRIHITRRLRVDRLGKHQLKPISLGPHLLNLERCFAGPNQSLEPVRGRSQAAPASIAEPGKHAAVDALREPNHGGAGIGAYGDFVRRGSELYPPAKSASK